MDTQTDRCTHTYVCVSLQRLNLDTAEAMPSATSRAPASFLASPTLLAPLTTSRNSLHPRTCTAPLPPTTPTAISSEPFLNTLICVAATALGAKDGASQLWDGDACDAWATTWCRCLPSCTSVRRCSDTGHVSPEMRIKIQQFQQHLITSAAGRQGKGKGTVDNNHAQKNKA